MKSLVANSQQVIQSIESLDLSAYPNVTLVSLDVESLYLSIPQATGIEMVLQRVLPTSPPQPIKNFVRDLLKIVIRDNTSRFHDDFFNQIKGVAMGTRCAPPFANLFLGSLEEKALATWSGPYPLLWLRFLDDILMLCNGDNHQLSTFLQHLNDQMHAINFTMTSSQESITFLDLEIYKGHRFNTTGTLDTKLYKKPTNPQPSCTLTPATVALPSPPLYVENSSVLSEPPQMPRTTPLRSTSCWNVFKNAATPNNCS